MVKVPEFKPTDKDGNPLASEKIRAMGQELEQKALQQTRILEGIQKYCFDKAKDPALKDRLDAELKAVYERHNEFMLKLNSFRKELMETVHNEVTKAREKEVVKNAEEKKQKEKEFEERREKILAEASDLIEVLEGVCDTQPDEEAPLDQLQNHMALMEKAREETDKYFKAELEKAKKETISSGLMLDLITLQRKGRQNNTKVNTAFDGMRKRVDDKIMAKRDECLEQMRKVMRKRSYDPAVIFDSVTKNEVITLDEITTEFKGLSGQSIHVAKTLPWPLTKPQFTLGLFNLCKVKGTMEAEVEVEGDGKNLTIKSDAMLEVLKDDGDYTHVRMLSDESFPEGKVKTAKIRKLALKYDIMK